MGIVGDIQISSIIPVLSLIAGWVLNEMSVLFRSRGDRKRNLSKALAELLEIHHPLIGKKVIVDEIQKKYALDIEKEPEFTVLLDILEFDLEDISKRYSEVVTLLSAYDPLLAFNLRSKDKISPLLSKVREFGKGEHEVEEYMHKVTKRIENTLIPVIEEAIREVAWKRGVITWFRVNALLDNKKNIADRIFEELADFLPQEK